MIHECTACFFSYNETLGIPEDNILPGTPFADIPDDWICPDCGLDKSFFEPTK